jgi:hypothetical protein
LHRWERFIAGVYIVSMFLVTALFLIFVQFAQKSFESQVID